MSEVHEAPPAPRRPPSPRPGVPGVNVPDIAPPPPVQQPAYVKYDYKQNCTFCGTRHDVGAPPPAGGAKVTREPLIATIRRALGRFRAWWLERWHAGYRAGSKL